MRSVLSLRVHKPGSSQAAVAAWMMTALLAVAFAINYADRQVVFSVFPAIRVDLGFSDAQLGLAASLFTWTYSALMPLTGRLADRLRRERLVIAAILLWSLATLGSGLSNSIPQFLFWRVVMGITEALYVPAAIGLITSAHSNATRSRALAVHGAGQVSGIALGGWFGGWAADNMGWRAGFALLAVVGLCWAAVLAATLRAQGTEATGPPASQEQRSSVAALVRSRCYLGTALVFLVFCALLWVLYAWLPTFVYERYREPLASSGWIATVYLQASSACGILLGGYVGDRVAKRQRAGRFYVVSAGLFAAAPFAYAIFAVSELWMMKAACCGFGLFSGFLVANVFASIYDVVPPSRFGFATGLVNLVGGLGAGAAMLAAGVLARSIGFAELMLFTSAAALLVSALLFTTAATQFGRDRARAGHT